MWGVNLIICYYNLHFLGDPHCSSDYKPGFLTDEELKQLVVEVSFYLVLYSH